MPEDTLGPDTLSTRGIPTARRGYDRKVVDALIADAVAAWSALEKRHAELVAQLEASGGLEYLQRDLAAIAADAGRMLAAATEAADGLRSRAREDADRVITAAGIAAAERVTAADGRAAGMVTEADRQAFQLRRDAWDEGMRLLVGVHQAVADVLAAADEEVQVIRADAEKETHRRMAITRKEAEEIIRNARYEADRQVTMARELAQEMLDRTQTAEGPVIPTAGERQRRREIMAEIERLRSERTIEEVSVLPAEPAPGPDDAPELMFGDLDPQATDLSDALAAEVEELRSGGGGGRGSKRPREEPAEPESAPVEEPPPADDVGTLFEALRTTAEHEPVEAMPGDPVELRDRLVLPLYNQGLRDVKRRIVDLQNVVLDSLREQRPSAPEIEAIAAQLAPAVEPMIQKAAAAGARASGVLTGASGAPVTVSDRPHALVRGMAGDLAAELRGALGSGGGPAEAVSVVSRVFRAWRGDAAERWVRSIAFAGYHDSLLAALAATGSERVAGIPSGRPCPKCVGPGRVAWSPGAAPPDGLRVPPADLDCLCTVAPVTAHS
jgi:cell division septum initiation protein DivIVA